MIFAVLLRMVLLGWMVVISGFSVEVGMVLFEAFVVVESSTVMVVTM